MNICFVICYGNPGEHNHTVISFDITFFIDIYSYRSFLY